MTTLPKSSDEPRLPVLDARLAAAAAYVRPGRVAADIGCDHGKLSAWLAGSGRCPRVIATDLRPGPLQKAQKTCAPWQDRVELRLGDGLTALRPGEATELVLAGMGAETMLEILDAAPWVQDGAYRLILAPATKHSLARQGLARRGFALLDETLARAAGRTYTVLCAGYDGRRWEPDGLWCLCGRAAGQPGAGAYFAAQCVKLEKFRRSLGDAGPEAAAVDALIAQLKTLQQEDTPCL